MEIEFDPAKDAVNVAKHSVSLALAKQVEWDGAVVVPDCRHDYGELRHYAIAYIGRRLHVVVFADRGDVRRIISLRKANDRERNRYAEAQS